MTTKAPVAIESALVRLTYEDDEDAEIWRAASRRRILEQLEEIARESAATWELRELERADITADELERLNLTGRRSPTPLQDHQIRGALRKFRNLEPASSRTKLSRASRSITHAVRYLDGVVAVNGESKGIDLAAVRLRMESPLVVEFSLSPEAVSAYAFALITLGERLYTLPSRASRKRAENLVRIARADAEVTALRERAAAAGAVIADTSGRAGGRVDLLADEDEDEDDLENLKELMAQSD